MSNQPNIQSYSKHQYQHLTKGWCQRNQKSLLVNIFVHLRDYHHFLPGRAHWEYRMGCYVKDTMLIRDTEPSPSPGGCVSKTASVTEIGELRGSWKPSKASFLRSISLASPPDSPSALLSPRVHRYSQDSVSHWLLLGHSLDLPASTLICFL